MISNGNFLSDSLQNSYRNHAADCIWEYDKYINVLIKWIEQSNFQVQPSLRNNLKDAWLHYRKIYEQRQCFAVIEDIYAMEEHLNRAIKDAMVYFYQEYLILLEWLYGQQRQRDEEEILSYHSLDEMKGIMLQNGVDVQDEEWLIKLTALAKSKGELDEMRCLVKYIYWFHIYRPELLAEMQNLIHKIKEFCLRLRFDGAKIYRPQSADEYMDICINLYDVLMHKVSEYKIKHMVRQSKSIWQEESPIRDGSCKV